MKRSDMLDIINRAIDPQRQEKIKVAIDVLKAIEEAGMLPPGVYVPMGPYEDVEYEWDENLNLKGEEGDYSEEE